MRLNDSQWIEVMKLVMDNMEREIDIIREASSSWAYDANDNLELTPESVSEIEGIKQLGKTLISEIRQIPMEGD